MVKLASSKMKEPKIEDIQITSLEFTYTIKKPRKPRPILLVAGNFLNKRWVTGNIWGAYLAMQEKTTFFSMIKNPQQARKLADWLNRWADWKEYKDDPKNI